MRIHRTVIAICVAAAVAASWAAIPFPLTAAEGVSSTGRQPAKKPNIIFCMADDLAPRPDER